MISSKIGPCSCFANSSGETEPEEAPDVVSWAFSSAVVCAAVSA